MRIFYYFITDLVTNEKKMLCIEDYVGEPNDIISFNWSDHLWVITDYAVEWEDIDEPEDY